MRHLLNKAKIESAKKKVKKEFDKALWFKPKRKTSKNSKLKIKAQRER